MNTEDIPDRHPGMWIPESNPETIALLSKMAEEASELASRCNRAIMQGWDGVDPDSGRTNAAHVWDETADVDAMMRHLSERRATQEINEAVMDRSERKYRFKLPWFDFLKALAT